MNSRGRLITVPTRQVVTLDGDLESGIVAYRKEAMPSCSDSEVIRAIIRDWLTGHGYLPNPPAKEETNYDADPLAAYPFMPLSSLFQIAVIRPSNALTALATALGVTPWLCQFPFAK